MSTYRYQAPSANREKYLREDWIRLRDEVLEEADHKCVECGNKATTVHHKSYSAKGGLICDKKHLQALWWPCHESKHAIMQFPNGNSIHIIKYGEAHLVRQEWLTDYWLKRLESEHPDLFARK